MPAASTAHAGFFVRTAHILARTVRAFMHDNIAGLGAGLAFYTTLAIAPLLVLSIAVAGVVFNETSAWIRIITEVTRLMGKQAGGALRALQNPHTMTTSKVTTAVGLFTLLFGALGAIRHLRSALNAIWRVESPQHLTWKLILRGRMFSGATVIATGFLLLVSLVASAILSWAGGQTIDHAGLPVVTLQAMNFVASFLVITLLFAIIFKMLPDTDIEWRHVWLGSAATAGLFTGGKGAIGYYLSRASLTSAYGAAGSLVVLLLWAYYTAQIVFIGAELTRIVSLSNGGRDFSRIDTSPRRNPLA